MSTQQHLLDEVEIRALVVRERYYKDTFQWDKWRQTYYGDGGKTWIDIAWIAGTIDTFVAESKKMVDRIASTHFIQPVDVQIKADRALCTSYGHITLRFRDGDGSQEYDMVSWGWWIHRAQRTSTGSERSWHLLSLRFIYDRDSIAPTCPSPGAGVLHVDIAPAARQSYKYLDWTLTRRGYKISRTLPGTDDPASVTRLRAQEEDWLEKGE